MPNERRIRLSMRSLAKLGKLPRKTQNFMEFALEELENHNIQVFGYFSDSLKLGREKEDSVLGLFDSEKRHILIAIKNSLWFETFIHEYCHFLQHKNRHKLWCYGTEKDDKEYALHFSGKSRISERKANRIARNTRRYELDCERMAIELIKRHDLPINLEKYRRSANIYLASLYMEHKHQKYISLEALYSRKYSGLFSTKRISRFDAKIPRKIEKALQPLYVEGK